MNITDDDDDTCPMDRGTTQYQHTMLYVVQRCYHSGSKHYVPVDMLRLFHTQREAEEVAYHSARAFYDVNGTDSGGGVKTLMLPSYPAHNPQGSSHGFLACGGLFWVRALMVTVVTAGGPAANMSDSMCHTAAYAILTEGVIGGTGNRNSQRGTEVCDGRVFGGDATARVIATEAVSRVRVNLANPSLRVEALTVPVGKPPEFFSSLAFLKDWTQQAELGLVERDGMSMEAPPATMCSTTSATKRQIGPAVKGFDRNYGSGWGRTVSQEQDEEFRTSDVIGANNECLMVVDCPFEQPFAKRRRVVSVTDDYGSMPPVTMTNNDHSMIY
mmetsp:Transcript_19223/g.39481  ORF Transcript_19223/g.39481 Transcript_19223/m.39481 type:complete len:328 (-) Transcript_19223:143-1126(-)|eukprot:CAMPEP_0201122442 /NCGR_PEP_ID=MMETSP0850-20130426/6098_1 /ASSEMBLY_ACC=CAM_ASM_000622 /TAXON_ID=183588 /ORGANISM="Pseudo-nitzschia fraudulenta, Strain WWA7" /LENGTH=327 /DNA_ID=CAMNT_0047389145 /DNA_START=324 /DNA_END=1307 /DNA_ORIENTATION=+